MSERWPLVKLGDVADLCLGKMLDANKNKGRLLPYLRNPNVRWFEVDTTDLRLMPFEEHEDDRYGLRRGDVVICEGGEAGRAAVWDGRIPNLKFQKAIHRVRPSHELDARFLVHLLLSDSQSGRLADYYTGATIKHLTGQDLARYRFRLPPLPEQLRIAEILDKAGALRAKRRAALAQLDTLTQSIFLDMFGDTVTNSKNFPTRSLGQLIRLRSGDFLPASAMTRQGPHVVIGGNGVSGLHDRYMLEERHIVIGRVGAYCGCVHVSPRKSWVTDNALYISDYSEDLDFDYLAHALTYANLNQFANKSGQPLISGARIHPVRIVVPPRPIQEQFAIAVEMVSTLKVRQEESARAAADLFASLQHRAFSGEL